MISVDQFKKNLFILAERVAFESEIEELPDWFRRGAILILFWTEDNKIKVVLTRRSDSVSLNKGIVSLPGGSASEGESYVQSALREAEEEIGIDKEKIQVAGRLDPFWTTHFFQIIPIVGWYDGIPKFTKNRYEVEEILIFDLFELTKKSKQRVDVFDIFGIKFKRPFIEFPGGFISGLTADTLLEAIEIGLEGTSERGSIRKSIQKAARERGILSSKDQYSKYF